MFHKAFPVGLSYGVRIQESLGKPHGTERKGIHSLDVRSCGVHEFHAPASDVSHEHRPRAQFEVVPHTAEGQLGLLPL